MPIEYLALWGVAQVAGFVFKPILEDLASKGAEGFAEDYLKGCLKSVLSKGEKDALTKVVGTSLKDFLQIVQEELEGCGFEESAITPLVNPVQQLIAHRAVQATLRAPLVSVDIPTSAKTLADSWNELHLPNLPNEFSWGKVANRFAKKANQLRRESAELRDVLDSQTLEAIAASLNASAPISPDDDLRRLQRAVLKAYGYLKLEAMDATTFDLNRIRLDHLFIPQHVREFTDFVQQVFELPKELQQRVKRLSEIQGQIAEQRQISLFRKAYFKQAPRSVLELMQDRNSRLLVILGDPGSGKSSLLHFTALQWAEYAGHDIDTLEVPFVIDLREYVRNRRDGLVKDFLEYLQHGVGVACRFDQHAVVGRLRAGTAALLFDGLDEVFDPEHRKEVSADIARFANDFPTARLIVTSRVIGYKAQTLRDAGFRHFMLQDLDYRQIEEFLHRWHALAYPVRQEGEDKRLLLSQAINESKAIRELAGNPLLLTMMAILNRTQDLPRDRAELYTQCSRLLLYQWKADDALRADERFKGISLDFKDKQAMLRRVARSMQASEQGLAGNFISQNTLERVLEEVLIELGLQQAKLLARAVIEQLRTRNFILCYVGGDHYAFVHRTFLEYFCATDFMWQFKEEQTIDLSHLMGLVFEKHYADETWHETLCLICGMLVPKLAGEVIEHMVASSMHNESHPTWSSSLNWFAETDAKPFQSILLAARCFAEVRNKGEIQATGQRLRAHLQSIVGIPLPQKRPRPAKLLRSTRSEADIQKLLEDAKMRSEHVSKIRAARPKALAALGTIWRDDETLKWLKGLLQSISNDASIRDAALRQLTDNWGEAESTYQFIYGLAADRVVPIMLPGSAKSISRLAALSHLVRKWPERHEVGTLLETLATDDQDSTVQEWAVQQIGQLLKTQSAKVETIHKVINANPQPAVRRECFRAMAKLESPDSTTLALAKTEVHTTSGAKTKRPLLKILAKSPQSDLEIAKLLEILATTGLSQKLNREAKAVLKTSWIHLPEVRAFLEANPIASNPTSRME